MVANKDALEAQSSFFVEVVNDDDFDPGVALSPETLEEEVPAVIDDAASYFLEPDELWAVVPIDVYGASWHVVISHESLGIKTYDDDGEPADFRASKSPAEIVSGTWKEGPRSNTDIALAGLKTALQTAKDHSFSPNQPVH